MTTLFSTILAIVMIFYSLQGQRKSEREHDSLKGTVHDVHVSVAKLSNHSGKLQEGKPAFLQSFTYGNNGALIEKKFLDGGLQVKHLYSYDSKGNRSAREIERDGSRVLLWLFKHDAFGNRTEEVISDSDSVVGRMVYKYDTRANRVEETISLRHIAFKRWTYSYDDKGNAVEGAEYRGGSTPTKRESYSYEFDPKGNWIKKVTSRLVSRKGQSTYEPLFVTYREITYY